MPQSTILPRDASRGLCRRKIAVRLSFSWLVCHNPVLYQNGATHRQSSLPTDSVVMLHRESKIQDIKLLAITSLTIIRFSIFLLADFEVNWQQIQMFKYSTTL